MQFWITFNKKLRFKYMWYIILTCLIINFSPIHLKMEESDFLTIEVVVEGFENTKGQAILALYGVDNVFPDTKDVLDFRHLKIESGKVITTFKVSKKGNYAIAVHHDANKNGVMDKNLLGIPTEAYGFSNNPVVRFRAPTFKECKFNVDKDVSLNIKIK